MKPLLVPKVCKETPDYNRVMDYPTQKEGELAVFLIESYTIEDDDYDIDGNWFSYDTEYVTYHQINYDPVSGLPFEFRNERIYDLTCFYNKWTNFLKSLPTFSKQNKQQKLEAQRIENNLTALNKDYYLEEEYYYSTRNPLNLPFLDLTKEELDMLKRD